VPTGELLFCNECGVQQLCTIEWVANECVGCYGTGDGGCSAATLSASEWQTFVHADSDSRAHTSAIEHGARGDRGRMSTRVSGKIRVPWLVDVNLGVVCGRYRN
jgi:hypothetical protein